MAAISKTIGLLLQLYGKYDAVTVIDQYTKQIPGDKPLEAMAFYLRSLGIETVPLQLTATELQEMEQPFLLLAPPGYGNTTDIYHCHQQALQLLASEAATLTNWPTIFSENRLYEALAFDATALMAITDTKKITSSINKRTPWQQTVLCACIAILLLLLVAAMFYQWAFMPITTSIVVVAALCNTFFSIVLLLKEQRIGTAYTKAFCGNEKYMSCSRLIASPFSKSKLGISWAALGLFWFLTPLLYLLSGWLLPCNSSLLLYWLIASVATGVYLIVRMQQIKVFCKLCLLTHITSLVALLLTWLFTPTGFWQQSVSIEVAFVAAGCLLIAGCIVGALYYALRFYRQKEEQVHLLVEYRYGLLEQVLRQPPTTGMQQVVLEGKAPLVIPAANEEDSLPLLLVIGLHCQHCSALLQHIMATPLLQHNGFRLLLAVDAEMPITGTAALLQQLQAVQHQPEAILLTLSQWYKDSEGLEDESALAAALPAFCTPANALPLTALPGIFIAHHYLPPPIEYKDIDLAFFMALQRGDEAV